MSGKAVDGARLAARPGGVRAGCGTRNAGAGQSRLLGRALHADGQFAPPAGLLLEIGGCRRLFGGVAAIVEAALAGCAAQDYSVAWAAAPTPLGACWLAQAGRGEICEPLAVMQAVLADLPCAVPGWPAEVRDRLASFGLARLGDLRALPAAGLRRRIGNGPLDDMLRAWGEIPDPQQPFVFPETFAQDIELPARVEHAEALAFAGQRLFATLAGWLHGRQLLARVCRLQLTHDDGSRSVLTLRLAEPAADEGRFAFAARASGASETGGAGRSLVFASR